MGNDTTRCPRCDDYDEVVEELKNEKELRDRESKDALRKCEEGHKKKDSQIKGLEKKIVTITIVAAIAGTVVGKELVDKIASYINSFNSVKNAATNLVGVAEPTTETEPTPKQKSNTEKKTDDEEAQNRSTTRRVYATLPTRNSTKRYMGSLGMYNSNLLDYLYADSGGYIINDLILPENEQIENTLSDYMEMFSNIPIDTFSLELNYMDYLESGLTFDLYSETEETPMIEVPEATPLTLFAIALPISFAPRRRRK